MFAFTRLVVALCATTTAAAKYMTLESLVDATQMVQYPVDRFASRNLTVVDVKNDRRVTIEYTETDHDVCYAERLACEQIDWVPDCTQKLHIIHLTFDAPCETPMFRARTTYIYDVSVNATVPTDAVICESGEQSVSVTCDEGDDLIDCLPWMCPLTCPDGAADCIVTHDTYVTDSVSVYTHARFSNYTVRNLTAMNETRTAAVRRVVKMYNRIAAKDDRHFAKRVPAWKELLNTLSVRYIDTRVVNQIFRRCGVHVDFRTTVSALYVDESAADVVYTAYRKRFWMRFGAWTSDRSNFGEVSLADLMLLNRHLIDEQWAKTKITKAMGKEIIKGLTRNVMGFMDEVSEEDEWLKAHPDASEDDEADEDTYTYEDDLPGFSSAGLPTPKPRPYDPLVAEGYEEYDI